MCDSTGKFSAEELTVITALSDNIQQLREMRETTIKLLTEARELRAASGAYDPVIVGLLDQLVTQTERPIDRLRAGLNWKERGVSQPGEEGVPRARKPFVDALPPPNRTNSVVERFLRAGRE
jgi:hypothetical protein